MQIHREKNFYYTCLKEIIQEQAKGNNIYDQMTFIKSKLLEIEHERLKNYSLKVSPASISSDETISLFQISSSITKQYSSSQLQIRTPEGITSNYLILKPFIKDYFSTLFSQNQPSDHLNQNITILNNIRSPLSREDSEALIRPIEKEELRLVVKQSAKKKSPGPDGITYEFYEHFFEQISDD